MAGRILSDACGYSIYSDPKGYTAPPGDFMDPRLDKIVLIGSVTGLIRAAKGIGQVAIGAIGLFVASLERAFLQDTKALQKNNISYINAKRFIVQGAKDLGRGLIALIPVIGIVVLSIIDGRNAAKQEMNTRFFPDKTKVSVTFEKTKEEKQAIEAFNDYIEKESLMKIFDYLNGLQESKQDIERYFCTLEPSDPKREEVKAYLESLDAQSKQLRSYYNQKCKEFLQSINPSGNMVINQALILHMFEPCKQQLLQEFENSDIAIADQMCIDNHAAAKESDFEIYFKEHYEKEKNQFLDLNLKTFLKEISLGDSLIA